MALLSSGTSLTNITNITTVASFISHSSITGSPLRWKEESFEGKMDIYAKPAILSLFMIFAVSVGLLQEQTFERVSIKYGKVIKTSQVRSVRTCVDTCLQHCECRYVRFTKNSKVCQLFDDVLLYYGIEQTPPSLDVVDFKKVSLRLFNSQTYILYHRVDYNIRCTDICSHGHSFSRDF